MCIAKRALANDEHGGRSKYLFSIVERHAGGAKTPLSKIHAGNTEYQHPGRRFWDHIMLTGRLPPKLRTSRSSGEMTAFRSRLSRYLPLSHGSASFGRLQG